MKDIDVFCMDFESSTTKASRQFTNQGIPTMPVFEDIDEIIAVQMYYTVCNTA